MLGVDYRPNLPSDKYAQPYFVEYYYIPINMKNTLNMEQKPFHHHTSIICSSIRNFRHPKPLIQDRSREYF